MPHGKSLSFTVRGKIAEFKPAWESWATFSTPLPPTYLALYDMNNASPARLEGFIAKVKRTLGAW